MTAKLNELVKKLKIKDSFGKLPVRVEGISQDSGLINPGFVFVARKGDRTNGMDYVPVARQNGAVVVFTNQKVEKNFDIPMVQVADLDEALNILSRAIYEYPSRKVRLVGLTGTDGKTSSAMIFQSIIRAAGYHCGLIGTVSYETGYRSYKAGLTTPSIDRICQLLREIYNYSRLENNGKAVWSVMEVSSHALVLGRVNGLRFHAVGLTNIFRDHLDFHGSLEKYARAKAKLFEMIETDIPAVINIDSPFADLIIKHTRGRIITFGKQGSDADITVKPVKQSLSGSVFRLWMFGDSVEVKTTLVGSFQGENIALAAGIAFSCGIPRDAIVEGVRSLQCVPGRMELVNAGQSFKFVVDYSHTPNALETALKTVKSVHKGKLTAIFGAGGERDTRKRPLFGQVGVKYADRLIITSDNPRGENPMMIIDDILEGIDQTNRKKVFVEPDRRKAIELAVDKVESKGVILISGKGAEDQQLINGVKHPFDDRIVARESIKKHLDRQNRE